MYWHGEVAVQWLGRSKVTCCNKWSKVTCCTGWWGVTKSGCRDTHLSTRGYQGQQNKEAYFYHMIEVCLQLSQKVYWREEVVVQWLGRSKVT